MVMMVISNAPGSRQRVAFTLLELLVSLAIIALLIGIIVAAVQQVRAATTRAECLNHLRQIGLALHNHHDAHRVLPTGMDASPFPFLSWRARILPFIEQQSLWEITTKAFASDFRFANNPPHIGLTTVLPIYICPADGRTMGTIREGVTAAFSHYLGNEGVIFQDGVLFNQSNIRFSEITDGLSNTIAGGERPPSFDNHFGWWYAGIGQEFDGSLHAHMRVRETKRTFRRPTCPPGPYHFQPGQEDDLCSDFHFWSNHSGGANFLFADSSVRFLPYSADSILPALATRSGGEVVVIPND
jgi:prepilin-type processing-associated H-X9-DG protein